MLRLNAIGDTLWTKAFDETDYDKKAMEAQQTHDSGFIITGFTESSLAFSNLYLIRLNQSGDTLWTKTYGQYGCECVGHTVQQTADGGFIVAGSKRIQNNNDRDVYILRTNLLGDTLWTKNYNLNNDYEHIAFSIQETVDGGFIMVGNSYVHVSPMPLCINIIRTDSNGDSLWTKTFGDYTGNGPPVAGSSIRQTFGGGYIVAGTTESNIYYVNVVYLIRLDKDTTAIQQEISSNYIKPNNFIISYNNGNISIRYTIPHSSSVKLSAYDTQGKLVKVIQDKFMQKGSYSVRWDSNRFGSGVYFLKLSVNGTAVSKKITIIK